MTTSPLAPYLASLGLLQHGEGGMERECRVLRGAAAVRPHHVVLRWPHCLSARRCGPCRPRQRTRLEESRVRRLCWNLKMLPANATSDVQVVCTPTLQKLDMQAVPLLRQIQLIGCINLSAEWP